MKNIISKILAIIVVVIIGYSVIWFFKTSSTKKYLSAAIASSDGKITAAGVSVSGFPLSQKIVIEDFKFQTDDLSEKLSLPNKYQVVIKKIEASSGLFSGDFKINNIGEISFQDSNGNSGTIEFNQVPEISFSFVGGTLTKVSYKDFGYKISDAAKATLYEGGSSFIEFESNSEDDDKIRHKIKAEFKDVDGVDIFTDKKIQAIIPAPADANIDIASVPANPSVTPNNTTGNTADSVNIPATDPAVSATSNESLKKYFYIDLEYILSPKTAEGAEVPDLTAGKTHKIESVSIKGLEISSPMYKITANADLASGEDGNLTSTCNGTVKIEKINNIITYIKKAINANPIYNPAPVASAASDQTTGQPAPAKPSAEPLTTISPAPEPDFAAIITDLAKKNNGTMDNVSVFLIKREKGSEFMINDTLLSELITKLIPAPASAPSNPSPAN